MIIDIKLADINKLHLLLTMEMSMDFGTSQLVSYLTKVTQVWRDISQLKFDVSIYNSIRQKMMQGVIVLLCVLSHPLHSTMTTCSSHRQSFVLKQSLLISELQLTLRNGCHKGCDIISEQYAARERITQVVYDKQSVLLKLQRIPLMGSRCRRATFIVSMVLA